MFKVLWALPPAKFFLILSVSVIFIFSSCNKPSVVGLDVQPENDLIDAAFQDTLTLLTQTVAEDTLRTDGNLVYTGTGLIGKYMDPVFGEATSSVYTQLRIPSNAPTFGSLPQVDSVVLTLVYNDTYGKKDRHPQTVNVYRLTEDLDINATYFSHQTKKYDAVDLAGGKVFVPHPKDSIVVFKKKQAPALRIQLDNSFGQSILDKQNSTDLATNDNFMKFIKGLYITTENTSGLSSSQGNIIIFNMLASRLNIYYHNSADDSLQFDLNMAGARFMHFNHNYKQSANMDLQKQLYQNSTQNDVVYVQSMAGVKTRVKIPHFLTWAKKDFIAINRAELIIQSISTKKDTFALIPTLNLFAVGDDGITSYVLPDTYEGSSYFGGTLDTTNNMNIYHFTITRHLQQLVSKSKNNNGLFITSTIGSNSANRIVLGGGSAKLNGGSIPNNYQMKLNITYTKLK